MALNGARSLKYVDAILTNWEQNGFKAKPNKLRPDPNKYTKGKYAHIVQGGN